MKKSPNKLILEVDELWRFVRKKRVKKEGWIEMDRETRGIMGETNHIERFNNTLRQRVSRLGRKTLF